MVERQSRISYLKDLVRAALEKPDRSTFPVPYQGKPLNCVEVQVPIDFPLYNVRSGRTHRAQSAYVEAHHLPEDYFADPEDPQVQRAQSQILAEMIDEKGLAQDLREKSLKNPLVLTYDGQVIDGNRRLAALREDKKTEYVKAVQMPETATAAEIYETEIELQMARETKAEYNWLDEALHVRYGIQQMYATKSPEEALRAVMRRMNRPEKEVRSILERLDLVDLYLAWLGEPRKHHLLPSDGAGAAEQAFKELAQRVGHPSFQRFSPEHQRATKNACFAVIQTRGGYMDIRRVYDQMSKQPTQFLARVREALPPQVVAKVNAQVKPVPPAANADDLLGSLAEANTKGPLPGQAAQALVGDSAVAKEAGATLMRIAEEIEAEQKDAQRHSEPAEKVARALRDLQSVRLTKGSKHLDQLAKNIALISETVERIAREIEELRAPRD